MGTYSHLHNDKGEEEARTDMKVKDEILKPLNKYLVWTGQCFPFPEGAEDDATSRRRVKQKQILHSFLQVAVALLSVTCFVYTLCLFPSPKKLYDISYYFFYYPITTMDQALWEFRWLLTCWLGIGLSRAGIWQELFDESMTLRESRMKKVKVRSWLLGAALILMLIIQEIGIFWQMDFELTKSLWLGIFLDAVFMLLDRTLAFPLFLLLCVTMYILCYMVEEYVELIQNWPLRNKDDQGKVDRAAQTKPESVQDGKPALDQAVQTKAESVQDGKPAVDRAGQTKAESVQDGKPAVDRAGQTKAESGQDGKTAVDRAVQRKAESVEDENSARERFRIVKRAIRNAGQWFELYLMFHFLFLLGTFFLGVCACFEQMEVRISENYTMAIPFGVPREARFANLLGKLKVDTSYTLASPAVVPASTLAASSYSTSFALIANSSGSNDYGQLNDLIRTTWLKKSLKSFAISTLTRTLESLFLYLVPIYLMVRLKNCLRQVYEVIEDSDVEDQKKKNLLFENVEVIRRMCKYVKTAHGLRIFGHTVPTFEAFMLAAFTPFATLMLQRLLISIHMKQG